MFIDRRGDLLPLGDSRQRRHVLELIAEGFDRRIAPERRRVPCCAMRRKIAGQLIETDLLRRLGEELDQLPGLLFSRRRVEDDQARAAAIDIPGQSLATGAGIGAVAHFVCMFAGRRRLNSPTFHGPVR